MVDKTETPIYDEKTHQWIVPAEKSSPPPSPEPKPIKKPSQE